MKERPILLRNNHIDAICNGRKTMLLQGTGDAVVITCNGFVGVTDTPCPFGEIGDMLVPVSVEYKARLNITLEVVSTKLANLTYEVTDEDSVALGYESKSHMIAKDFPDFHEEEDSWVWLCRFKIAGGVPTIPERSSWAFNKIKPHVL